MTVATTAGAAAPAYTDLAGLTRLRADARAGRDGSSAAAGVQFESVLMNMMLAAMRTTVPQSGLFQNDSTRLYTDLMDKQVALDLAGRRQLGLADLLTRQVSSLPGGDANADNRDRAAPAQGLRAFPGTSTSRSVDEVRRLLALADAARAQSAEPAAVDPFSERVDPGASQGTSEDLGSSPGNFVTTLRPHAEAAARELGVAPEVLLAQAALETGWGTRTLRRADGSAANNLFGIKADSGWAGARAAASTLEFRSGTAVREQASFRAYDSYGESFRDYVRFIRENPRYGAALQRVAEPAAYVRSLQKAGYATDPNYARKVLDVMQQNVLPELKLSQSRPLETAG